MTEQRKFRFGTNIQAASRDELRARVRTIEDLGYNTVYVTDHVSAPRSAPIATLAAVAALDSSLRLTSTVMGNDFRHPAFLASEAATIDLISDGRLELGIGAGWLESDYVQPGLPFDSPGTRIDRLTEAIEILKGLFSGQPFSFSGQHDTIQNLDLQPKPVQQPYPPLLIGGGGKRMLSLAAREADIVSINPTTRGGTIDWTSVTDDAFAQKMAWVREAAGRRLADLELHCLLFGVIVSDDQQQAAEQWIKGAEAIMGVPVNLRPEEVLASPFILCGTIEHMVEKLQECRERYGISYITIPAMIQPETFAEVVARLAES